MITSRTLLAAAFLLCAGGSRLLAQSDSTPAAPPALPPPTLGEMLDSAALHAGIARLPALATARRIERVFTIAFDSTGQPRPPRAAVPQAMDSAYLATVGPLIAAALRPIAPRRGGAMVWLHVEPGDPPRLEITKLDVRWPSITNGGDVRRFLTGTANELVSADTTLEGSRLTVRVFVRVDTSGVAESVHLVLPSNRRAADAAALHVSRMMRFQPMLLDGEPVVGQVVVPIVFEFPKPGGDHR